MYSLIIPLRTAHQDRVVNVPGAETPASLIPRQEIGLPFFIVDVVISVTAAVNDVTTSRTICRSCELTLSLARLPV